MSELKATTAQEIVRNEKDCDYMDELFGGVNMPPTQVYLKSEADAFIADLEESNKKEVEQLLIEIVKLKEKHKKEVDRLLMKIAGLEKLVETADKLVKQKGGFTIKDVTFDGVKLEGTK